MSHPLCSPPALAERFLHFSRTTLKSLEDPQALSQSEEGLIQWATELAVRDVVDWCLIQVRGDSEAPVKMSSQGRTQIQSAQLYSFICVPIRLYSGQVVGAMSWARTKDARPFDDHDLVLAEEFAQRFGCRLEMVRRYDQLLREKSRAEKASAAKTQFLANVSHELRTPLGPILGFSELLASDSLTGRERELWGLKVRQHGAYLLRIVDDILDLSKVEAGQLQTEHHEVDLKQLLQDLLHFARQKVQGKDVRVQMKFVSDLPRFVISDETRLLQVLSNLVGNAVKYTQCGTVLIQVGFCKTSQTASFEIWDSGIGISSSQRDLLFQPFARIESEGTKHLEGTGLGLALAKKLAQRLEGDVFLKESHLGQGSCFVFKSKIIPAQEESFCSLENTAWGLCNIQKKDEFADALTGRSILLVEDSVDIQMLMRRILEGAGAKVTLAADGFEGLKAATQGAYDLILMDVQMPGMDGCEVVSRLRCQGYGGLVVALTANAMKEQRDRCLQSGFDDHLSKPMRRHDLLAYLVRLLTRAT